jgi:soluble lytic murein transglycosylase-like protein
VADAVVVLSAPDVKTGALHKAVQRLAGGAAVQLLRPADVAPTAITGKPKSWRELYIDSARYCPGLSWTVLAAIGQVESGHGRNLGPSSAGALGPMQFMPATWVAYGLDGDADGTADIMNPFDAVPSAARYLCRHGATNGDQGLYDAVFAYNHADWYVRKILGLAAQYR